MWGVLLAAGMSLFQWAMPRILAVFGVVALSQTIYLPMLDWIQNRIQQSLSGLPADAFGFLQFTGIPTAVTIIFAAITLRLGIKTAKAALAKKGTTPDA